MINLSEYFGNIDIYLFDQFLKNRFSPEMKILDAVIFSFVRKDFES